MLGRVGGPRRSRWRPGRGACRRLSCWRARPFWRIPMASRSWLPGDLAVAVRALQAHPVKCAEWAGGLACWVLAGEEECMESAASRTAMFAAVSRGLFRLETESPRVLDDVLALVPLG